MSEQSSWRIAAAGVAGLAAPLALGYSGLAVRLGAHPIWAHSTALMGALAGVALALVLGRIRLRILVPLIFGLTLCCTGIAGAAAGKIAFVNSYGDDFFAGKIWYAGWIIVQCGLALLIVTAMLPRRSASVTTGSSDNAD